MEIDPLKLGMMLVGIALLVVAGRIRWGRSRRPGAALGVRGRRSVETRTERSPVEREMEERERSVEPRQG